MLKTDKSGKLTVISRNEYEKLGKEKCKEDRKLNRTEIRRIERRINEHSKWWCKMINSGASHNHQDRIIASKQSSSENTAPKYYMFKDHKIGGGYRPVVGGCSSDTLGLSNTLSEVVESVAKAVETPFEVISSEDMLSRIYEFNKIIPSLLPVEKPNRSKAPGENDNLEGLVEFWNYVENEWNWKDDYIILGSDVCSLFPSLSAERTCMAVRKQIEKSKISWQNVNWRLITLYIKLNEKFWEGDKSLDSIKMLLPTRIKPQGRPPSIGTLKVEQKFKWPTAIDVIGKEMQAKLMGFAM